MFFDVIFSVGVACRPAYCLRRNGLRLYANPLDWMMSYSLDTVIHLYKTKFNDFFVDFVEDELKPHQFTDVKNNITSVHYANIRNYNEAFRETMINRFEKINKRLIEADKICFISNRNEDFSVFSDFLEAMGRLYSGEITLINIRDNKEVTGIKCDKKKISERLELIEYEFNDVHPNGIEDNFDCWQGNILLWDSIVEKISIEKNFSALAKDSDVEVRCNIAGNKNTPIEILKELVKDSDSVVREQIPVGVLIELANDNDCQIRKAVAENTKTPIEILNKLAKDTCLEVRIAIAYNDNTPTETLTGLAKDSNDDVRSVVAFHENTSVETLESLVNDSYADTRFNLAENERTPIGALDILARDKDADIRRNVAKNPNTSEKTLKRLAEDSDILCPYICG